jgi:hypothetical protein
MSESEQMVSSPKLWNPNAAANWSLAFTPILGAWLHAKNWQELKQPDKAKSSMLWVYAGFVFLAVLPFLPENVGYAPGFLFLLAWYLLSARTQVKFIKDNNIVYEKRRWKDPLLVGLAGLVVYVLLAIGVASIVGSRSFVENRVLIVRIADTDEDSHGIELFKKALKQGGEVEITVSEIRDEFSEFESDYAITSEDGTYYVRGTILNFVAGHGWRLHSIFEDGIIFQKK